MAYLQAIFSQFEEKMIIMWQSSEYVGAIIDKGNGGILLLISVVKCSFNDVLMCWPCINADVIGRQ